MAKMEIKLQEDESVCDAIRRADNGPLPIINFEVEKLPNESVLHTTDDHGVSCEQRFTSFSQSIRRADDPNVELGVATGSVGGEYQTVPNMEAIAMFYPVHDDMPSDIVIWNADKGRRCGVEAKTLTTAIGTEQWIGRTTVQNSFDLTRSLETSCVLVRASDGLRYPVTLQGGVQAVKHTKNAKIRADKVSKYREQIREVLDEQVMLMHQFSRFNLDWTTFKNILLKACPIYDPDKATGGRGITRRTNMVVKISKRCHGAATALDCLLGFMTYLSLDAAARSCEGKDKEEVKFLSLTDGDKFGKLKAAQKAVFEHMSA